MKIKRLVVILVVLIFSTVGLFATIEVPESVSAKLYARIGEYLEHGFNNGTSLYNSSIEVYNAFGTTPPSFKYGYRTNANSGGFSINMTVGDFINQDTAGTVKIKAVNSSKAIVSHGTGTNVYEIFRFTSTGLERSDETTITIRPFLTYTTGDVDITNTPISSDKTVGGDGTNAGAPEGLYLATVTLSISSAT